jgi:opacity protein-like surface antigen
MSISKKPAVACLCACALAIGSGVVAVPGIALSEEASPPIRHTTYDWSGAHIGILIGLNSFRTALDDLSAPPSDLKGDGRIAGIIAGYNFTHDDWVFGPELDVSYGLLKATENGNSIKSDVHAGLRMRLGHRYARALPYVNTGLALTQIDYTSRNPMRDLDSLQLSVTAGAGLEVAFTPALSGRIEYQYAHAVSDEHRGIDRMHMIRAAASYHFNHQ